MKKALSASLRALPFLAALVVAPSRAYAAQAVLVAPKVAVLGKGPRVSRLQNRAVWNDKGLRIGTIADFIVNDDYSLFAVLQIGGFLGVGGYLVAVPFKILAVDRSARKIVLAGATREALQNYPEFRFQD